MLPIELSQASALPFGRTDALPPVHTHGLSRARTRAPTRRQDPHNCLCQAGTQGVLCLRCKLLSPVLHLLLPLLPPGSLRAPDPAPGLGIAPNSPAGFVPKTPPPSRSGLPPGAAGPGLQREFRGARAARKDPSSELEANSSGKKPCAATPPTPQKNRPKGHRGAGHQRTHCGPGESPLKPSALPQWLSLQ